MGYVLSYQIQGLQSFQSLAEQITLLHQRNLLLHGGTDPKELAHFVEGTAKTGCRWEASKPAHGIVALLDPTVVLLNAIIKVGIGSMHDISAERLADGTWIGVMSIGCHPLWGMSNHCNSLAEELLCGIHVPFLDFGVNRPDFHPGRWRDRGSTISHEPSRRFRRHTTMFLRVHVVWCAVVLQVSVPRHSYWPQNRGFDINLALLVSRNTSFVEKSTTHKTSQSADLFAYGPWASKSRFPLRYSGRTG